MFDGYDCTKPTPDDDGSTTDEDGEEDGNNGVLYIAITVPLGMLLISCVIIGICLAKRTVGNKIIAQNDKKKDPSFIGI